MVFLSVMYTSSVNVFFYCGNPFLCLSFGLNSIFIKLKNLFSCLDGSILLMCLNNSSLRFLKSECFSVYLSIPLLLLNLCVSSSVCFGLNIFLKMCFPFFWMSSSVLIWQLCLMSSVGKFLLEFFVIWRPLPFLTLNTFATLSRPQNHV